jgi:hypothetical protein
LPVRVTPRLPGGSYRSQWWALHNENGAYSARGIHGQAIYIDPAAEMVIARFATFPISFNAAIDPTSLPAYQAVADYLIKKVEIGLCGSWYRRLVTEGFCTRLHDTPVGLWIGIRELCCSIRNSAHQEPLVGALVNISQS